MPVMRELNTNPLINSKEYVNINLYAFRLTHAQASSPHDAMSTVREVSKMPQRLNFLVVISRWNQLRKS